MHLHVCGYHFFGFFLSSFSLGRFPMVVSTVIKTEDDEDPHGWVVASTSFRPTLAAVFPAWNPEISLGQSAPCQSPPGQIFVLFGSRPTRGSQPASLRFPHGSNPRAMRPGGFPRASPRRVATVHARAALPLLAQELQVARPPLRHLAVAATPASCRHLPSAFLSLRLTPMVSPPQPTSLCLPLGFRVS